MSRPPDTKHTRILGGGGPLPKAELVEIHDDKVVKYLLNENSVDGAPKRKFLLGFGFADGDPQKVKDALERHALTRAIVETHTHEWGTKYVLECDMLSPDRRNPCIKTVWMVDAGDPAGLPKFITMIPKPSKGRPK